MRRGSIASLLGLGIVAGGITAAVALALPWLPKPASNEADRIDFLFWFVIVICIVIFALVAAGLGYSILPFPPAPAHESAGPPLHRPPGRSSWRTPSPTILLTTSGVATPRRHAPVDNL